VIEEPDPVGFLGLDRPRRKQELLGDGPADLVRQGPGTVDAAVGGGEKAEARVLAADPHVERRRQHRGPAVRQAVHHPDGGLGAGADLVAPPRANGAARVELGLRVPPVVLALLVDVAAGGERPLACAGDHDAPDLVVGAHPRDRLPQLGAQLGVHRVQLLRAIQGENRHAFGLLHEDDLVCHVLLPSSLTATRGE
jgi:hypothetical protein